MLNKIKIIMLFGLILLVTSCVVSNQKFFSKIESSNDKDYGYTAKKPIKIKNGDEYSSIQSSYYFLSRLRTADGRGFKLIYQAAVGNPNYQSTPFTNRYTGMPIGFGGMMLDKYCLVPNEGKQDTVILFINPFVKGDIKIPMGLKFEKEIVK
jgi:hypothetical protein